MSRAKILVADDEPNLRRVLSAILTRSGYEVIQAADGREALDTLAKTTVDVVITDLKMPRVNGMEVLRNISINDPTVPVIMITAFGTVGNAVAAVKAGAFDYIEKPFEQQQIRRVVETAVKQCKHNRTAPQTLLEGDGKSLGRFGLIGSGHEMCSIYEVIEKVADTPSTVLITGESGTGKELVAKALHENSSRRNQSFIKINCAAIPKNLMESELFGYEKGAFTGATTAKPGRFELANDGTLFLDEIGEIPLEMQVKLLRAIQESEFERVGGIKTLKVNVRLITATNRDLEQEVQNGAFREDLFYRLNVVPIQIPPLRSRKEDIPQLVHHIMEKLNERLTKNIQDIDDLAMGVLSAHSWPGNIRELENVLERTLLFCKGDVIKLTDLPDEFIQGAGDQLDAQQEPEKRATPEAKININGETSLKEIVRAQTNKVERELITEALNETGGNVTQAAKLLKISRKSLQMKMKLFDLRDREGEGSS